MREGPPYWSNMKFESDWFKIYPHVKVYKMHLIPASKGLTEDKAYDVVEVKRHSGNNSKMVVNIIDDDGEIRSYDPGYLKFADEGMNQLIEILFL